MFAGAARRVVRWCLSSYGSAGPRRGSLAVTLAAALGALAVFAAAGLPAHAGQAPVAAKPAAPGHPGAQVEVPSLRTRTSRTYRSSDGSFVARIWGGSVNYRDAKGHWQPIDDSLQRAGSAFHNRANRYRVQLPQRLGAAPIRVSSGSSWVSLAPLGASAPAAVSGARATFAGAWPGVSARYDAEGDAVKETLVLADAAAARSFDFAVSASAGLRAHLAKSGAVALRDARGRDVLGLSAPVMSDAAGADGTVGTALRRTATGWVLTLTPDRAWLAAPARRWPVTIDPSIYPNPDTDCFVSNSTGNSDTDFCGDTDLDAGYGYAAQPHDHHTLLKFDVQSVVPAGSDIVEARLWLYLTGEEGTASKDIYARRVTASWDGNATWNHRDANHTWATPGGDFTTTADDSAPTLDGSDPGWVNWTIQDMVDGWSTGRYDNDGVLLADDESHSTLGTMHFSSSEGDPSLAPNLEIQYDRRIGDRRGWSMQRFQLSDRIQLAVNAASGNLLLSQRDVTIPGGMGPDLTLSRSFNSLRGTWGAFSGGWTWDTGNDYIVQWFPDAVVLYGPSGYQVRFPQNDDGSYKSPPGLDETLKYVGGGEFTLTDNSSQDKWTFGNAGRLVRMEDRNGRAITYTYDGLKATTITDNQGRQTTISYDDPDDDQLITGITDPAGRQYQYDYEWVNGWKLLSTYTDPDGGVTHYDYNANYQLVQVTTPGGRVTKIDYYTSGARAGKVLTITRVTNPAAGTGPVTEFDYTTNRDGSGTGTVTDPNSNVTHYTFDKSGLPLHVTDALGRTETSSYTDDANVQDYTEPTDTGLNPSTHADYDSSNNLTKTATITGAGTTDASKLRTAASYGATWTGGTVTGAAYLPTLVQDEQDMAGGGTSGIAIEYHNAQGDPTKISKGTAGSVTIGYAPTSGTGASWDGNPGQLASTTDGNGNATTYGYDTHGNLTTVTPPVITGGIGATTLSYGGGSGADLALSRISEVIDGREDRILYTYDNLDRITKICFQNSSGVETAHYDYAYDDDGNLTERDDVAGLTTHVYTFHYDDLNRVTEEDLPGSVTNLYGYDAASNLTSFTDAGGTVTYTYDAINREKTIQEPGASTPITYTYNDWTSTSSGIPQYGQQVQIALPNGVTTTNDVDAAGRLQDTTSRNASGTTLQQFAYQYRLGSSEMALVSQEKDMSANTVDYTYDPLNRIWSATNSAGNDFQYNYDAAGNLTSQVVNGTATTTYRYNADNELCWSVTGTSSNSCGSPPSGATTASYDAAGDQTTLAAHSLSYNEQRQLTSFDSTTFTYAGAGQNQRTSVGSTTQVNGLLGLASDATSGVSDYFTRDENGAFLSQRQPSASAPNRRTYALVDQLGSTRTLTDENGTVVRRYAYDPYGNDASPSGSWTTTTPLQFGGGYLDPTGLYHLGDRYYSPAQGRWTQPDPLNDPSEIRDSDPYAYAGDDPVNLVDPTGLSIWDDLKERWSEAKTVARNTIKGASTGASIGALAGCALGRGLEGGKGCVYGAGVLGAAGAVGGGAIGAGVGLVKAGEQRARYCRPTRIAC